MTKCTPSLLKLTRPYLPSALIQHPPHSEELGSLVIYKLSLQLPSLILRLRFRKLLGPETAQRTLSPAQTFLQELTFSGCHLNGALHWHLELL